jgi:hypothetical protein
MTFTGFGAKHQTHKPEQSLANLYKTTGSYTVLTKVLDILGNETTKRLNLDIKI